MPSLTVRNIPDPIYSRLREQAMQNRRSMSNEIVMLLEAVLMPQAVEGDPFLHTAEQADAWFDEPLPDLIAAGKREGRKQDLDAERP